MNLITHHQQQVVYILLVAGGGLLSSLILWSQLWRYTKIVVVSIKDSFNKHFKNNLILFIPVMAVSIYTVMDKIMLGNLCHMDELGFYDNIQKIMTVPTGIITALGMVMFPRISNLLANGKKDNAFAFIDMSMQFSNFLSVALCFGLSAIAPCFIVAYYGNEFRNTSLMMELFSVTIIFISWANVIRTQYLIPSEKDRIYIISVIAGAIVNVVVNLLLIPVLNAIGAVIGTIGAEAIVAIIQTVFVRNELNIKKYFRNGIVFFVPGIVMFVLVRVIYYICGISIMSLILQILVGTVSYLSIGAFFIMKSGTELSSQVKHFWRLIRNKVKR